MDVKGHTVFGDSVSHLRHLGHPSAQQLVTRGKVSFTGVNVSQSGSGPGPRFKDPVLCSE